MRVKFSQVIDLVLALSAAIVATAVGLRYFGNGLSPSAPPVYKLGETIPDLPGIDFAQNNRTLLLVLRSGCQFCTASMPFYRRLVAEKEEFGPLALVALSTDDEKTLANYLHQNGLQVDRAVTVRPGEAFRAGATPSLILINNNHRIVGVWTGQLSSSEEKALLKTLCVTCTAASRRLG